nr:hypothetical protein GCM10020093_025360 [Planobispora longispora]
MIGWVLRTTRTHRPTGLGLAVAAAWAALVLLSGWAIVADQWPPRRPYGFPLLACGAAQLAMLGLLLLVHRRGRARG